MQPPNAETGEEAEYESRVTTYVKVECEGFATVTMETEYGSCRTLFGNGSSIHTMTNGESVIDIYDGSRILCDSKGMLLRSDSYRGTHKDISLFIGRVNNL